MRTGELLQRRELAALSLLCLIALGVWVWAFWPARPALTVTFLNVGQGDAAVVRTPSGRTILIDAGPGPSERESFDAGAKVIVPFLRREGINKIDVFILTHPHEDHMGGAPSVLANLRVERVLDPGIAHPSGRYEEVLSQIEERKIGYRRIFRGQVVEFGDGVRIEVLNPSRTRRTGGLGDSEINNCSAVLRLTYGRVSFILAGDAEKGAEAEILSACGDLSAHVLKVAHHGSAESSTAQWLAAVRPRYAVISVGWRNPFGHPSRETVNRLREIGAEVYRTDRNGGITVTTDGHRIALSTSRS